MLVSLGEALVDLIPASGDSLATADTLSIQPGGSPFNVAIALGRLGVPVTFAGTLSSDGFGDRLRAVLNREGIEHVPQHAVPSPTRLAVIDHGSSAGAFRFYGDNPADSELTVDHIDGLLTPEIGGLYVSSLMMRDAKSARVQQHAINQAVERQVPVFADPNPRSSAWPYPKQMQRATEWLLAQSTIAKLSLDDARSLGWPAEPEALIEQAKRRWDTRLVVTAGEHGCWFGSATGIEHMPPFAVETIDPTGAGDAFFAALIARSYRQRTVTRDAIRFAAAVGALTVTRPGAVAGFPAMDEIERLMATG